MIEDIRFLERSLSRLTESFRLEKDEALAADDMSLLRLREREKNHYGPEVRRLLSDLRGLRHRLKTVQGLSSAIFDNLNRLESNMKDAGAKFTGTVNRLCRYGLQGDSQCTE